MNGHNALFSEEMIKTGNGVRIAPLPESTPESDQTSVRIASTHVAYQFDCFGSMLIGMMMKASRTVPDGIPRTVITVFPTLYILTVGLIFTCSFRNTILFSVFN